MGKSGSFSSSALLGLAVLLLASIFASRPLYAAQLGSWNPTTAYPEGIVLQSCTTSGGYIYCVGGQTSTTGTPIADSYYAPLSSSGVGQWTKTTSYPSAIEQESCATTNGYIYCVGGINSTGLAPTYFAPISSNGIGPWLSSSTSSLEVIGQGCAAANAILVCLGFNTTETSTNQNFYLTLYSASLSSSGIGAWTGHANYPVPLNPGSSLLGESCAAVSGDFLCVGGYSVSSGGLGAFTNETFLIPLSTLSTSWAAAADYPIAVADPSCAASSGAFYCVGGISGNTVNASELATVGYATLSSSGSGQWASAQNYPIPIAEASCVVSGGYLYCVGGLTGAFSGGGSSAVAESAVYYASITSSSSTTSTSTTSTVPEFPTQSLAATLVLSVTVTVLLLARKGGRGPRPGPQH